MTRRLGLLLASQCAFAGALACGFVLLRTAAPAHAGVTRRASLLPLGQVVSEGPHIMPVASNPHAAAGLRKAGAERSDAVVIVDAFEESEDAPVHRRAAGVLATHGGFIFTPAFVVEDADFVIVTFGENRSPARVIARDPSSQLAILKTSFVPDGSGCPELGDEESERANTPVVLLSPEDKSARTLTGSVVALRDRVGPLNHVLEVDVVGVPSALGGIVLNGKGQLMGLALATATPEAKPAAQGAPEAIHSKVFVLPASRIREAIDRLVRETPGSHEQQPSRPISTT